MHPLKLSLRRRVSFRRQTVLSNDHGFCRAFNNQIGLVFSYFTQLTIWHLGTPQCGVDIHNDWPLVSVWGAGRPETQLTGSWLQGDVFCVWTRLTCGWFFQVYCRHPRLRLTDRPTRFLLFHRRSPAISLETPLSWCVSHNGILQIFKLIEHIVVCRWLHIFVVNLNCREPVCLLCHSILSLVSPT